MTRNWQEDTGWWQDGAESSVLSLPFYEARVRQEGLHVYYWFVNAKTAQGGQRVDQGTAVSHAFAQYHAEQRICWHAKQMEVDAGIDEPTAPRAVTG